MNVGDTILRSPKFTSIHAQLPRLLALTLALSGCATLPSNGPTAGELVRAVNKSSAGLSIALVDINAGTLPSIGSPSASGQGFASLNRAGEADSPDMIRPGDTLSVTVYEVGVSLFSAQSAAGNELGTQVTNPAANAQRISGVQVDEAGGIQLPYIGYIAVAGLAPRSVEAQIEKRLQGMSQSPRAIVSIADSLTGTFYLSGAISKPGRYRLSIAREHLREYIAIAGGVEGDPEDTAIRITRGGVTQVMRLDDIPVGSADDIMLLPGDQVEVLKRRRTYTTFGASDRIAQVPFETSSLSLSEAIARAGGPSDARANPRGIFLFRLESGAQGESQRPVIYRLDLMKPGSYFLAQQIAMQDKDLIYFANSSSGPPSKLIGIINQLFGPFVTARALTQ